jgi:hypothetical protein
MSASCFRLAFPALFITLSLGCGRSSTSQVPGDAGPGEAAVTISGDASACAITVTNPQVTGQLKDPVIRVQWFGASEKISFVSNNNRSYQVTFSAVKPSPLEAPNPFTVSSSTTQPYSITLSAWWHGVTTPLPAQGITGYTYDFVATDAANGVHCDPTIHVTK